MVQKIGRILTLDTTKKSNEIPSWHWFVNRTFVNSLQWLRMVERGVALSEDLCGEREREKDSNKIHYNECSNPVHAVETSLNTSLHTLDDLLLLNPWTRLTVTQLVKKFPACYETQRYITVFTTTSHWSYPDPDASSPQLSIIFF